MADTEEEYEVENVVQARVVKKNRKLAFEYRVKWRGYPTDQNTWEPSDSFTEGSEHILESFWERVGDNGLQGRDRHDMKSFKLNEEFLPKGRPRKTRKSSTVQPEPEQPEPSSNKSKSQKSQSSPSKPKAESSKRKRPSPEIIEIVSDGEPPAKRSRQNRSTKKPNPDDFLRSQAVPRSPAPPKRRKKLTPEIIPPSDESETEDILEPVDAPMLDATTSAIETQNNVSEEQNASPAAPLESESPIVIEDVHDASQNNTTETDRPEQVAEPTETSNLPLHRARVANPLVKMVDDFTPEYDHPRIAAKSRAVTKEPQSKQRPKPGPGRSSSGFKSSLLTWDKKAAGKEGQSDKKGSLVTLRGKYQKPVDDRDRNPTPEYDGPDDLFDIPTAPELLQLAGLKETDAEGLDDFEEDAPAPAPTAETPEASNPSLTVVKDKLFPPGSSSSPAPSNSFWGRSSIFGPLGLGSASRPDVESIQESNSCSFILNVNPLMLLPVYFVDISSHVSPSLNEVVKKSADGRGPCGAFYSGERSLAVLNTFRTGGSSARVVCSPLASPEQRDQFAVFKGKLDRGDLFVIMAGSEVLALCSSENSMLFQRFNLSPELSTLRDSIVVSLAKIEDRTLYLKLIMNK